LQHWPIQFRYYWIFQTGPIGDCHSGIQIAEKPSATEHCDSMMYAAYNAPAGSVSLVTDGMDIRGNAERGRVYWYSGK